MKMEFLTVEQWLSSPTDMFMEKGVICDCFFFIAFVHVELNLTTIQFENAITHCLSIRTASIMQRNNGIRLLAKVTETVTVATHAFMRKFTEK